MIQSTKKGFLERGWGGESLQGYPRIHHSEKDVFFQ